MLTGSVIKLANGAFAIECPSQSFCEPIETTHVFQLKHWRVSGYSWKSENEAIGRHAELRNGLVDCYLGDGVHLCGPIEDTAIEVRESTVPCPKVRRGTEVRWHHNGHRGTWQKYSKREGWIAA